MEGVNISESKRVGDVTCSPCSCLLCRFFPVGHRLLVSGGGWGCTLGISGWGCAAGTLELLTYNKASSAEFCYPILE